MNQIVARHQTMDMYGCKSETLVHADTLKDDITNLLERAGFHLLGARVESISDSHTAILMLLREGHCAVHLYPQLRYVAADLFLCEEGASPEKLVAGIRSLFSAEKLRSTYLMRGDFTANTDMKPKVKTQMTPLRRIHNTSAKVIRLLAHRKR